MTDLAFSQAFQTIALGDLRTLIDAGSGPGRLVYRAGHIPADTTFFTIGTAILADPCGTIADGVLTFEVDTQAPGAVTDGYLDHAQVTDSDGVVHLTLPIVESATPVANALAVPLRHIIADAPIYLMSFTIQHP